MPDGLDISARITADSSQLGAAMDSAAAKTQRFAEEMKRVGNDLTKVDSAFVETGQRAQEMATRMQAAGATAMTAAAQTSEGLNKISVNAGESRQAIVLLHEAFTGRFSRIPGSLMVLAERFGSLGTIVGALANPFVLAGAAAAGTLAVIGDLAYQAIKAGDEIQQTADDLTLLGRSTQSTVGELTSMRDGLQQTFGLGVSAATSLVSAFATLPGVTTDEAQQLSELAATIAKVKDQNLQKTAEEIAKEAQNGAKAFLDWAQKMGFELDPALVKNIEHLEQAGDKSGALRSAIGLLSSTVDANAGAWARATGALQSFISAMGAFGEAGPALAVGGAMGPIPAIPPSHPPAPAYRPFGGNFGSGETLGNTGNDETAVAKRVQDDAVAAAKDENQARITTLQTEIRSTSEMSKKLTLIRQLNAELVRQGKLGPLEGTAKANQEIAAAQASAARHAGGGAASKGQATDIETWRDELQQKLAAEHSFFADSTAEELAFWQSKIGLTAQGSKEQTEVANTIYQLQKRLADQGLRDDEQAETRKESLDRNYLAAFEANMKRLVATHQITKQQEFGFDEQYARQLEAQETDRLKKFIDDDRLSAAQKAQYYDRLLALEVQYDAKVDGFETEAANNAANAWKEAAKQVGSAFADALTEILDRSKTTVQAMSDLFNSLLKDTLKSTFEGVFSSLLGGGGSGGGGGGLNLSSLLFGSQGIGGALGLPSGGLFGSSGLLGSLFGGAGADFDAFGGIGAAASSAGGGLFSWLGSLLPALPFALPFFEKGGVVPSAAGGWSVPQLGSGGILAQLHSQEMVLPANISTGLQSMIGGGGGGGHTFNMSISATDASSVARLFANNGSALVAALNKALRNGGSLYAGAYS